MMKKLVMLFVLAVAAVCAVAEPAGAQTYGGASTGDLLGYRSSSGHYYRRSRASKARPKATRRRARKRRPAVRKSVRRKVTQARPVAAPKTFHEVAG
jgi:hypothetical protein